MKKYLALLLSLMQLCMANMANNKYRHPLYNSL